MQYNITGSAPNITLEIWEPAPIEGDRVKPFLWKIRATVPTWSDAIARLREHEDGNGQTAVHTSEVQNLCQAS